MLVVVGDLHAREKEPYFSQWQDFMKWFFNSEYNKTSNTLLLLGDLVESINVQHELLELYIDYFNNKSLFEKIIILTGNHDRVLDSSLLSIFRPLKNVFVIDTWTIMQFGKCKCLLLPHIEHSLIETYSSLNLKDEHFDYCFHHIEDEDQHFDKKYTDLSYLSIDNFLCGHIHSETITKQGHFLGSPTFNSLNEKDKIPLIATIDLDTKKYTLEKVPVWLSYQDVYYPEKLPEKKTKYCIYTIFNSIDKEQSLDFYTKQAKENNFDFYCRRVHSRQIKNDELQNSNDFTIKDKSLLEYFNDYKTSNAVEENIANICINVLQRVNE